jgi:hypothetical protein
MRVTRTTTVNAGHSQTRENAIYKNTTNRIIVVNVSTFAVESVRDSTSDVDVARQHRDRRRDRRMRPWQRHATQYTRHTTTHQSHYYNRHSLFEGNS